MREEISTKPYLIRAIHEWCVDSGLTPYLAVKVDAHTRVPTEYVKNGEIVLNVSHDADASPQIGNELIQFSARFNGVSRECSIPVEAVLGIFARENGQGLFFPVEPDRGRGSGTGGTRSRADGACSSCPKLQIVK